MSARRLSRDDLNADFRRRQGDELAGIQKKAMATGAVKCIVKDLRKEFVEEYLWPMLRAGAIYENNYLLGTSIARPLIAKHQVMIAHQEGATAVAHGLRGATPTDWPVAGAVGLESTTYHLDEGAASGLG